MKQKAILILIICFSKMYSQKIEEKTGSIKITKEVYYIEKKKKMKRKKNEFFFDTDGKLLQEISFGTPHNKKLNNIGEITQYFYSQDNLISEKKWISNCNCKNQNFILYNTDYLYNENNLLIKEIFSNPVSSPIIYKYEENKTEIHSGDFYIQRVVDNEKRLIQLNQIAEKTNNIRWQYLYEYKNNCRIGHFQTYYGDGKENTKSEIINYDLKNRIISQEIINYNKTKIVYKYSEKGIIDKIEEYESPLEQNDYKLSRLTKIKINKIPKSISTTISEKLNPQLL